MKYSKPRAKTIYEWADKEIGGLIDVILSEGHSPKEVETMMAKIINDVVAERIKEGLKVKENEPETTK